MTAARLHDGDELVGALERAVAAALEAVLPGVIDRLAAIAGPHAYSVAEVAERLGVSDTSVYTLIRDGKLTTVPHVKPTRIAAAAIDRLLAS